MDSRAAQEPSYYQDFAVFAEREGIPEDEAEDIALQLEQHGFVRRAPTMVRDAAAALDTAFAALAFTALAFTAWYAIAIGLVALTAVLARTPERRRDARQVLTILLRKTPR